MGKGVAIHFFWKQQKFPLPQSHPKIHPSYHILRRWRRGRCHFFEGGSAAKAVVSPRAAKPPHGQLN